MMAARGLAWLACLCGVASVGLHFVPKPSAGMPTYFFILGMEGTGHHFWSALGGALAALEPLGASEAGARALDGLQHRVKLCFLQLSRPKAPGACDGAGCAAGASCRLNATAETRLHAVAAPDIALSGGPPNLSLRRLTEAAGQYGFGISAPGIHHAVAEP